MMMFEISSSPVSAVIVTQAVMSVPAFVMKIFEPSISQRPSRSSARVRVAPASEPAPGSVSPNAARRRPEARSGSHSCFCCSLPNKKIGIVPSDVCAATVIAVELLRDRRDLLERELPHGATDELVLVGEVVVGHGRDANARLQRPVSHAD